MIDGGLATVGLLLLAAAFAGFIDAVAGGGGLIQVPALLTALPGESPATVFGTNKGSSIFGTANAAWRYARRIALPWEVALPAAAAAFVFSFGGAAVHGHPDDWHRHLLCWQAALKHGARGSVKGGRENGVNGETRRGDGRGGQD